MISNYSTEENDTLIQSLREDNFQSAKENGYFYKTLPINFDSNNLGIYNFSYGLKPTEFNPISSLNYSRINNVVLTFRIGTTQISNNIEKI